jgi:hypothetical protein
MDWIKPAENRVQFSGFSNESLGFIKIPEFHKVSKYQFNKEDFAPISFEMYVE